jgi:hypothetical protein
LGGAIIPSEAEAATIEQPIEDVDITQVFGPAKLAPSDDASATCQDPASRSMICLLVGVYYQMVWPATLQKVCHYKCPYFVGMSNKDRDFIRYGEVCEPTKFVER